MAEHFCWRHGRRGQGAWGPELCDAAPRMAQPGKQAVENVKDAFQKG